MKQFKWAYDKMGDIKPVVLDGALYVYMSMAATIEAILTSKEVYEYMVPWVVFYLKMGIAVSAAGAGALKMFRSKQYSEHRDTEDAKTALTLPDQTQVITQQQTTKVETKPNEAVINPIV